MLGAPAPLDLAALYAAHRLPLARYALLLVDDMATAEDVVHHAFIALHQYQSRLRDPAAALGYLRTTVVNNCRSVLRKRQTVRRHLSLVRDNHAEAADSELAAGRHPAGGARRAPPALHSASRRYSPCGTGGTCPKPRSPRPWASPGEPAKSNASRGMDKLEAMLGASR